MASSVELSLESTRTLLRKFVPRYAAALEILDPRARAFGSILVEAFVCAVACAR